MTFTNRPALPSQFSDMTKEQLIAIVLDQQEMLRWREPEAVQAGLAVLRSCTAPTCQCRLCPSCVHALFRTTPPMPLTLPQKYVESEWALGSGNGRV